MDPTDQALLADRFVLRGSLRCDGAGALQCGEDARTHTRVAIRSVPLAANGARAVEAISALPAHPALPAILTTGTTDAAAYVAMEFPEGEMLSVVLANDGQLPPDVVLRLGVSLADGLAALHQAGLVHGELSADSVLLVGGQVAYLFDVPLVLADRLTDRRGEHRVLANLPRTVAYLAPERACGQTASAASDVYALGALMCIAAGAIGPQGATTLEAVHRIVTGDWQPVPPLTLPSRLRMLIEQMVARDASERPSVAQVASGLRWLCENPLAAPLPLVSVVSRTSLDRTAPVESAKVEAAQHRTSPARPAALLRGSSLSDTALENGRPAATAKRPEPAGEPDPFEALVASGNISSDRQPSHAEPTIRLGPIAAEALVPDSVVGSSHENGQLDGGLAHAFATADSEPARGGSSVVAWAAASDGRLFAVTGAAVVLTALAMIVAAMLVLPQLRGPRAVPRPASSGSMLRLDDAPAAQEPSPAGSGTESSARTASEES